MMLINNHIFQGNELKFDKVEFEYVIDMNKRGFRKINIFQGSKFEKESFFEITVTDINIRSGAGFVVIYLNKVLSMPEFTKFPVNNIDVDEKRNTVNISQCDYWHIINYKFWV